MEYNADARCQQICIETVLGHPSTNDPAGVILWVVTIPWVIHTPLPTGVYEYCTPTFPLDVGAKHGTRMYGFDSLFRTFQVLVSRSVPHSLQLIALISIIDLCYLILSNFEQF